MLTLFAHGAGAPSSSPWMVAWKLRLQAVGRVVTFDYPYVRAGRRAPDPLKTLVAAHREALDGALREQPGPVILAGKSMGGRVGCHLALEDVRPRGLVCFGYPLTAAGKSKAMRDQVLLDSRVPVLFLQGTRDPLCALDQLETVRAKMTARSELFVVEGGDHSLLVSATARKASGKSQRDYDGAVLAAVERFVAGL